MNDLARRLIAYESGGRQGLEELADATERVCHTLRVGLARLVGRDGSHALLTRAVKLAKMEFPSLEPVQTKPEGGRCLEGLDEAVRGQDAGNAQRALIQIVASLMTLLGSFIGEHMTEKLVQDAWVKFPHRETATEPGSEAPNNG